MSFDNLPEDLFIEIFLHLDVYTTLSINSHIRPIALSSPVWRRLFDDLVARGDYPLRNASPTQLIDIVKSAACGPTSKPTEFQKTLSILGIGRAVQRSPSGLLMVHPDVDGAAKFPRWTNPTILGAGGRHIFFMGWATVFCWSVDSDELVWSHTPSGPVRRVRSFAANVLDSGKNATVALCFMSWDRHTVADVIDLNLDTGASETLMTIELPESTSDIDVSIYCNIVAFKLSGGSTHVFANWSTKECCALSRRPGTSLSFKILEEYTIFVETYLSPSTDSHMASLGVISISALDPYWKPTCDCRESNEMFIVSLFFNLEGNVLCSVTLSLPPPRMLPLMNHLWVLESPVQQRTYRIWVCIPSSLHPAQYKMYRYHLFVPPAANTPKLSPRQQISHTPQGVNCGSLAPHAIWGRVTRVQPMFPLPQIESVVDISPYSNGFLYATYNAIHGWIPTNPKALTASPLYPPLFSCPSSHDA
ncbi:hypothetical protein C8F01DRAFT_1234069 [Mycena amicta]|nr:hypothetical protein C8F01DRAFT_1234069 [Mycena amicta]